MTAITTTPADLVEARPTHRRASRSAALRRGFFVASPILAGILLWSRPSPTPPPASTARR